MRLPPLTALRAFECAGRKLSFTLAAQELGVTPGAVSRQISLLEDFLGAMLFFRANREVSLTPVGSAYLQQASEAFAQISAATAQIVEVPQDAPIRVSTSITFILRWLTPRLVSYHSKHPDSNLQLTTSLEAVDFRRGAVDACIRLGHRETPHAVVRPLFRPDLIPVCSPALLAAGPPLRRLDDLAHYMLLHTTARPDNWQMWLNEAGCPELAGAQRLYFESSCLAYEAAAEGIGIAIGQLPLVMEDLRLGRLVAPFPIMVPDSEDYNLIWADGGSRNKGLARFRDWIFAEARETEARAKQAAAQIVAAAPSHLRT